MLLPRVVDVASRNLATSVDTSGSRRGRAREVNGIEDPIAQQEAVLRPAAVEKKTRNFTASVDAVALGQRGALWAGRPVKTPTTDLRRHKCERQKLKFKDS